MGSIVCGLHIGLCNTSAAAGRLDAGQEVLLSCGGDEMRDRIGKRR